MSNESQSKGTRKRIYQKPELTQVSLKPEEAVLGVCKTTGKAGPTQGRCLTPSPCSSNGS